MRHTDRADLWTNQARGKTSTLDLWRYERYGSFPRLLRFENDVLMSIAATSPK